MFNKKSIVFVSLIGLFIVNCANANVIKKPAEDNIFNEKLVEGVFNSAREGRSLNSLRSFWACGADLSCWLDKGDAFLEQKRNQFLGKTIYSLVITTK